MAMTDPNSNTRVPVGPGGVSLEFEELRDIIERLTPEETPFYSNCRKGTAKSLRPDWGTVSLPAITAPTGEKRGFIASLNAGISPARLSNVCELIAETGSVADSYDAVDLAGRDDESDFQKLLKGQYVRRRVNALMYANQAQSLSPEPSTMACFPTWVGTGRFRSVASTPGTASAGTGTNTYTAGTTPQALTAIDPVDDVLEACFATNGMPKTIYMNPAIKREWSRIPDASVAENRINMTAGTIKPFDFIGTVDVYLSDFGRVEVAVDRDCPKAIAPFVDPNNIEIATLAGRAFKMTPLAKVGSSMNFMIEWEGTLRVHNPTAHGMIEGLA